MLRLIHTADWQIGKPYGRVADGQKRFRLQQERLAAIGRIREAVERQQAELVLVAGDLFDSPTPAAAAVLEVLELIGAMAVPVLVIPGNHDHGAPGTLWHRDDLQRHQRQLAPNLQLLLERQPLVLEQAVVLPCPLLRNQDSSDPCQWLQGLDWSSLPAELPRIVLAHGGVHGFGGRDYDDEAQAGASNRIDLAALPPGPLDYIALGDWHNLKQVSAQAWYPGTPEPDRFDQGEDNQRGQVLLVELERGAPPRGHPPAHWPHPLAQPARALQRRRRSRPPGPPDRGAHRRPGGPGPAATGGERQPQPGGPSPLPPADQRPGAAAAAAAPQRRLPAGAAGA